MDEGIGDIFVSLYGNIRTGYFSVPIMIFYSTSE